MFKRKLATRSVSEEIPLEIQVLLWRLIDGMKNEHIQVDYLQVFELSIETAMGDVFQKIVHSQEQPPYKNEMLFNVYRPINTRLWAVDSGDDNGVLMYPSEY